MTAKRLATGLGGVAIVGPAAAGVTSIAPIAPIAPIVPTAGVGA